MHATYWGRNLSTLRAHARSGADEQMHSAQRSSAKLFLSMLTWVSVMVVVHHDYIVVFVEELEDRVAANVATASGNKNASFRHSESKRS